MQGTICSQRRFAMASKGNKMFPSWEIVNIHVHVYVISLRREQFVPVPRCNGFPWKSTECIPEMA